MPKQVRFLLAHHAWPSLLNWPLQNVCSERKSQQTRVLLLHCVRPPLLRWPGQSDCSKINSKYFLLTQAWPSHLNWRLQRRVLLWHFAWEHRQQSSLQVPEEQNSLQVPKEQNSLQVPEEQSSLQVPEEGKTNISKAFYLDWPGHAPCSKTESVMTFLLLLQHP